MTAVINSQPANALMGATPDMDMRPDLINKVDGFQDKISAAILLVHEDGLITVSEDRSVRVFLKRDTGRYWPSICHYLPAPCLCLDYNEETFRLFVGLNTGVISEFVVAEDYNSLTHKRDFSAHVSGVNCVKWAINCEWLLSAGKDKNFVWMCSETTRRLGQFDCGASGLCLEFDSAARYAFVGDFSGNISVLHVQDTKCELISKLSAHLSSIRALAWDAERQLLFSGSNDHLIIVWDIGGRRGTAYELNGFKSRVTCLAYSAGSRRLYACSESGYLLIWDMDVERKETPEWKSSDLCQRCDAPFFWNVKTMWERRVSSSRSTKLDMVVGLRQHHCRLCGQAVCDRCSSKRTTYPVMGYELPVRVCDGCWNTLEQRRLDDADEYKRRMRPLAISIDCTVGLQGIQLNDTQSRLLTIGVDRVVRLYDCTSLQRVVGSVQLLTASSAASYTSTNAHVENLTYGVGQLANNVISSRAYAAAGGNANNAGTANSTSTNNPHPSTLNSPFA